MADKIVARPLNEHEIKDLMGRANRALNAMQVFYDCDKDRNGENDFNRMIKAAIDIFSELTAQWALAVGRPQEISRETMMKIVESTVNNVRLILLKQIAAGKL